MDWIDVLIIVVRALVAFALWLVGTALLIWGERRLVARMQTRLGPNRLGPLGLFQVVADGAKLFFKEDIAPRRTDRVVYMAAPLVSAVVGMLTFAVIPYGGTFEIAGREVMLQVWDPEIGLLWFLAMSSIGVYGITLGGWASGSKYPLLGAVRSTAQMISYELPMGLSLAAVFVWTGSLRASEIVAAQSGTYFGFIPAWNLIPMSVAFVIFFISVVAEAQRPPFDLAEAEGELVAGFHTEYSGAKFAMFMLTEFMAVVTMSAIVVTLFLGGPDPIGPSPFPERSIFDALYGMVWFIAKVFVFVFVFVWLRGSLPRLRYDRLMDLGWKVMLPLSLAWVLATGAAVVYRVEGGSATALRIGGFLLGAALLVYLGSALFAGRVPGERGGGGGGGGGTSGPPVPDGGRSGRAISPETETAPVGPSAGDDARTPELTGAPRARASTPTTETR